MRMEKVIAHLKETTRDSYKEGFAYGVKSERKRILGLIDSPKRKPKMISWVTKNKVAKRGRGRPRKS